SLRRILRSPPYGPGADRHGLRGRVPAVHRARCRDGRTRRCDRPTGLSGDDMPSEARSAAVSASDIDRVSVFGWRYVSRQQTEQAIAMARLVLAGASLFAVWLDPAEPTRYIQLTYTLHAIYVVYALALILATRRRPGPSRMPLIT